MKTTRFGHHTKEYMILIDRYAKRLDADECIIHKDGSIDLYCKDGCICLNYRPSAKELYK